MTLKAARYAKGIHQELIDEVETYLPDASWGFAHEIYNKWNEKIGAKEWEGSPHEAFVAANDRYYLLTVVLRRQDAANQWVYERTREVEADPDGYLDLWARYHYKSSIITFAGIIQEVIANPEITCAIFSNTKSIAAAFLEQIKRELEENDHLKKLFPDVFFANPKAESPRWSAEGIIVKRKGNPKEATVEAHGVIDAMPTSRHFDLLDFDDLVTENSVTATNTDQITKTTTRFELALNLGHVSSRRWMAGTRYSYADTYGVLIDRASVKVRLYPATKDGTLNGDPVFLSPERWEEVKRDQRSTVAAQMLLNPLAGEANTFLVEYLRAFEVRPREMNIYIMGDPARSPRATADRTSIAVVGIDATGNRYLLDGYCHRMRPSERFNNLASLWKKWSKAPMIQSVRVGWERYGMQDDISYFEEKIIEQKLDGLQIDELAWPRDGTKSKDGRIGRLEPYFRNSQFWLPPKIHHPDLGTCTWKVEQKLEPLTSEGQIVKDKNSGAIIMVPIKGAAEIIYTPYKAKTKRETEVYQARESYRLMEPIKRLDENGNVYDLTRVFFEEYRLHPFAPHDDLIDATSRVEDMRPAPASTIERNALTGKAFADT